MSKDNRALKFEEIKQLLKKDGNFVQDTRFERTPDPSFKPWGKQSFRVINEFVPEPEPEAVTPSREDAPEAELAATIVEEATASELPPPPPPPVETETPPDPQAIIAALEQAREDGRALVGDTQG